MKNKTNLPKWFNGKTYKKGDTVTNPFSGATYKLTSLELSMYDFIMGIQLVMELHSNSRTDENINNFHKALSWFRKHNIKAYMALLD